MSPRLPSFHSLCSLGGQLSFCPLSLSVPLWLLNKNKNKKHELWNISSELAQRCRGTEHLAPHRATSIHHSVTRGPYWTVEAAPAAAFFSIRLELSGRKTDGLIDSSVNRLIDGLSAWPGCRQKLSRPPAGEVNSREKQSKVYFGRDVNYPRIAWSPPLCCGPHEVCRRAASQPLSGFFFPSHLSAKSGHEVVSLSLSERSFLQRSGRWVCWWTRTRRFWSSFLSGGLQRRKSW